MSDNTFDSEILSEKENIRRNIRDALTNKKTCNYVLPDLNAPAFEPISDPLIEFVKNFRSAGGKFLPCTLENVVRRMVKLIQGLGCSTILNTSPNLQRYLVKHRINYVNAIDPYYPVDAVLVFSDMLVARSGSIGVSQETARYASLKNLAKDIIVVSRDVCIFNDLEDAIQYRIQHDHGIQPAFMEFITPSLPKDETDPQAYQPTSPRILLLLVSDAFAARSEQAQQPKENMTENGSEKVAD